MEKEEISILASTSNADAKDGRARKRKYLFDEDTKAITKL